MKPGKFLSGKKSWIVALGVVVAGIIHLATGHDIGPLMEAWFRSMGWGEELSSGLSTFATALVPVLFATWASVDKLRKSWAEYKAGASIEEVGGLEAGVKLAIAKGVVLPSTVLPAKLATPLPPDVLATIKHQQKEVEIVLGVTK
jgi:hypothetical protein